MSVRIRTALLVVVAILSGTACSGVGQGAPAAPAPAAAPAPPPAPISDPALPLATLCIEHPHAFTLLAARCGFVSGTTRGTLATLHQGLDDWDRPLSSFLPDTGRRPMPFALRGRDGHTAVLLIRPDSLGLFFYDELEMPGWTRFATPRAPLVMGYTFGVARDTGHLRALLDSIEGGIRAAGGVLVGCRMPSGAPGVHDSQWVASWRLAHDALTLFMSLDTLQTRDTLTARWTIERSADTTDRPTTIDRGCVTPARADVRPFALAAARGYDTPARADRRFRTLVLDCEATRLSGVTDHPSCAGVPTPRELHERDLRDEERRRRPPPIP